VERLLFVEKRGNGKLERIAGGDRHDTVAAQDEADGGVGSMTIVVHGIGKLVEVLRAENAGCDEAEDACAVEVQVGVGMLAAARNEDLLAGTDFGGDAVDRPCRSAIDAEDGLVIVAVKVGYDVVRRGGDGDFEGVERTGGLVPALQEGDGQASDLDNASDRIDLSFYEDAAVIRLADLS
jgi:hypothetical protein